MEMATQGVNVEFSFLPLSYSLSLEEKLAQSYDLIYLEGRDRGSQVCEQPG